jgi:hypothetical protein
MLAKGAAGQVLTMNAGATAPEWKTANNAVSPLFLTKDEDYTISVSDVENNLTLLCTANSIKNFTLPAASSVGPGKIVYFFQSSTFDKYINVLSNGSDKIYGYAIAATGTTSIYTSLGNVGVFWCTMMSDGVDKWIMTGMYY